MDYLDIGNDVFIQKEVDSNGGIEIGISLPFGNAEKGYLTRENIIELLEHLNSLLNIY